MDVDAPEPPHPATWGASPPLPSLLEQASGIREEGGSMAAAAARLDADPRTILWPQHSPALGACSASTETQCFTGVYKME